MIQFPRDIHNLHLFQQDGQRYVADLDVGEVVAIDEVMWETLSLSSTCTFAQMLERLKDKYLEEVVFEAINRIEKYAQLGLLLSEESQHEPRMLNKHRRLRLFLMHDELYPHLPPPNALNVMNNHHLLEALAKEADVYLGVPEETANQIEVAEGSGFYKVPIKGGRTYSPVRYLNIGYDGMLALSRGYFEDLSFFCGLHAPVIVRIQSYNSNRERFINNTLAKIALLRDFDDIVADAPWLYPFFARWFPSLRPFHVIADGINLEHFTPMEKEKAKKAMGEILKGKTMPKQPVIGWMLGPQLGLNLQNIQELAAANQNIIFLIYAPGSDEYPITFSDNLYCFGSTQHWDMTLMPLAFNAMDILFFLAVVGTSASLLTGAMACGVPVVVASYAPFEGLDETRQFVQLKSLRTYNDQIPFDLVMEKMKEILHDNGELVFLGERARQQAEEYTWERAAKEMVSLFKQLNQKRMNFRYSLSRSFPVSFCRFYNKRRNIMQSQVFYRSNFEKMSVERGIALDLLSEHTKMEIEGILNSLCSNPEEAPSILNDDFVMDQ